MTWSLETFPDEAAWLAARRLVITSSDVPTILGASPYSNAFELWRQKVQAPEGDNARMRRRFEAGHAIEPMVAKWFREDTSRTPLRPAEGYYLITNPELPWAAVTPDLLVIDGAGPDGVVEGKSAGLMDIAGYPDSPAFHYATAQLHLGLDVLEMDGGWIATTFGLGNAFRVYPVDYSAELGALIRERCSAFHALVVAQKPPGEDFLRSGAEIGKALARIFEGESGELIEIEERFADVATRLDAARKARKDADDQIEELTNCLKLRMGTATYARMPGYPKLAQWKTEGKIGSYTVETKPNRVLRFVKDGKGKP